MIITIITCIHASFVINNCIGMMGKIRLKSLDYMAVSLFSKACVGKCFNLVNTC